MEKQCAWCLCLMDRYGEPVSAPQPKDYTVSHGMCRTCGSLWLEQALDDPGKRESGAKDMVACEMIEEEV